MKSFRELTPKQVQKLQSFLKEMEKPSYIFMDEHSNQLEVENFSTQEEAFAHAKTLKKSPVDVLLWLGFVDNEEGGKEFHFHDKPLSQPDGPGWWAVEMERNWGGRIIDKDQAVGKVTIEDERIFFKIPGAGISFEVTDVLKYKWWRLHMPWE